MRAVIQRVNSASVNIENKIFSSIKNGLLLFIGIEDEDNFDDVIWLSKKICGLRSCLKMDK